MFYTYYFVKSHNHPIMSAKRLKLKSSRKLLQDYKANKWKTWDFESGFADTNTMPCCLSSKNGFSILMPFTPCLSVLTSKMYVHLFLAMTLIGPSRLLSPYSGAFFFFLHLQRISHLRICYRSMLTSK